MTYEAGDENPFERRRVNDPQGTIDDLLAQSKRQAAMIHRLTQEKMALADPAFVIAWLSSELTPAAAFTAGPERQIADAIAIDRKRREAIVE